MKRSVQEIVELVVFGAIALLIGTGLLWVGGWVFSGIGWLFQAVSGLLWRLLIVLVPIIVVGGLLYWLATRLRPQAAATVEAPAAAEPAAADVEDSFAPAAATTNDNAPVNSTTAEAEASATAAPAEPCVAVEPATPAEPDAATVEPEQTSDSGPGPLETPAEVETDAAQDAQDAPSPHESDEDRPLRNG